MARYHPWRVGAMCSGVALTGVELWGALSYLLGQGQPSYLVAGGACVTILAAALPVLAERVWKDGRRVLAVLLYLMIVPALSVIVTAAIERTGSARDALTRSHDQHAYRIQLANDELAAARAAHDDALRLRQEYSARAAEEGTRGGCKSICQGLQAQAKAYGEAAEAAQARVSQARQALGSIGPPTYDPMVTRLAAVLPLSEDQITLYQPLVLPLAISSLGILMIAVAASSPKPRPRSGQKKKRSPPKRRPVPKKKLAAVQAQASGSVVPLRRTKRA